MLILHIYIKLNRLLHCFLTPASIHDYLLWFLCKMAYKHGAGILSACQWVCFQWQPMALIIVLILQGLYQECLPTRLQLTCHSESWVDLVVDFLLYISPGNNQWWHEFDTSTVFQVNLKQNYHSIHQLQYTLNVLSSTLVQFRFRIFIALIKWVAELKKM